MASVYKNYDKDLLNAEDYAKVQQAQDNWRAATTQQEKTAANQQAEAIRRQNGYTLGANGATYTPVNSIKGVNNETQYQVQRAQAAANPDPYSSQWSTQVDALANQILNRGKFRYDINEDALYNQYRDQYMRLGQQAMADTMGQAAGLTGGYGSTYSQNAGQQAYYGYLDRLNDIIPELYGQARDAWNAEGNDLYNRLSMAQNMDEVGYGRYRDALNDAVNDRNYWQSVMDTEYNRGIYDEETAYARQQDAYSRLLKLISATGYSPTADELAAAGMSQQEANQWRNEYLLENAPAVSGGSGGGGRESSSSKKTSDDNAREPVEVERNAAVEGSLLGLKGMLEDYINKRK